ncbi:hypothetical protein OS493_027736 [Desmophyllum pertusum]|uniref:C2H2-type domain-containing protein n=1 Tax=Desmophyllum pertusum TaxID=174260 RepID=A0A9W9Z9M3_9CNID|nr:hypothetical protein OS493_027736 [Desmophyllum pertusum]
MADEGEEKIFDPEKQATVAKKTSKRSLKRLQIEAASKLRCKLCADKKFTSLKMYDDHMASKKPQKKEIAARYCRSMGVKHLCGGRHHDKLKEWSARLFSNAYPITQQEIDLLDDSHYEETEDDNEEDGRLVE